MTQKELSCFDCRYYVEDIETPNFGYCCKHKEVVEKESVYLCKKFKPKERMGNVCI